MANILVIEDEPILARNICDSLGFSGHEATTVTSGEEGIRTAEATRPDVILLDYRLPGMDGLAVLARLKAAGSSASVVLMTAHGNIATAVQAIKSGAADFLTKPVDLEELQLVVERVLKTQSLAAELSYFRSRERAESDRGGIIGDSKPMRQVKTFIERITASPALATREPPTILITGETGTGKDLTARAIHYAGPRRDAQFVHVNCTAIPDHLAESELFGHVKGAFTDARGDKRGLFEIADHGTIFLNEIGHMPLPLQAKLLYVLENRNLRPVGGTKERKVDVHVIAATNRHLPEAIEAGEFRDDLYHRLRVLTITMPPLRERHEDVEPLARHFLQALGDRYGIRLQGFAPEALAAMHAYDWPGNVRELMHTVESALLVCDGPRIGAEHLNISALPSTGGVALEVAPAEETIRLDFSGDGPKLDEIEYRVIQAALSFSKNNLSRAARLLGISRDAVRYRMERFGRRREGAAEPDGISEGEEI